LPQHRWGADNDDFPNSASEKQLAANEPGLDGFSEANVVGYKEIHPGKKKGFAERLKLVRIDLNAGAKGRLEQFWIRCSDTVPTKRSHVSRKKPRIVESLLANGFLNIAIENPFLQFKFPHHLKSKSLSVVVETQQPDYCSASGWSGFHPVDQKLAGADLNNLSQLRGKRERRILFRIH
jgi:hypothetical protein